MIVGSATNFSEGNWLSSGSRFFERRKIVMVAARQFDYSVVSVKDLRPQMVETSNGLKVDSIVVNDQAMKPTERFWNSLFARYGFNQSIFKYFSHDEVFNRISENASSDRIRLCVDKTDETNNALLAVSNPTKAATGYDQLMELLENRGDAKNIRYHDGIVESDHSPRLNQEFDILGDAFHNQYTLVTPIDGYGTPNVYLGLVRMVCANGLVALSRAFRQQIAVGRRDDSAIYAISRVFDGFNHDQGFAALRQRVTSAGNSWASIYEADNLYKNLARMFNTSEAVNSKQIMNDFHDLVGDISDVYGLATVASLADKRKRTLPVKCTVYDLINFATEVSTHYSQASGKSRIHGFVGDLLTNDYDLEGSLSKFPEFSDFHISNKASIANNTPSLAT